MSRLLRRKPKALAYEQRLTLFVDFLGFREHVQRTVNFPEHLQRLVSAMDRVGEISRDDKDFHKSQRVTQFSDCIVVSYRIEEESAVFWLLNEIAFCVIDLVERGFLLRGALTVGDLLHTKKHVVGPALVEAYETESRLAKFPRILIDEKVLEVARASRNEDHTEEQEEHYVRAFMTKDTDERHYFDYISWDSVVANVGGDNDGYPAYLQTLGNMIGTGLAQPDPKVAEKYLWLHRQYLAAIEAIKQLPPDHPYRNQSPEVCDDIESLPQMNELAADVQQKLRKAQQT